MSIETLIRGQTLISKVFEKKDTRKLVVLLGVPVSMVHIEDVNLDWNFIYNNFGGSYINFSEAVLEFGEIPRRGLLTDRGLVLNPIKVSKKFRRYIESIEEQLPQNTFYLDFSRRHISGYGWYYDNLVPLYNRSVGHFIIKNEEGKEFLLSRFKTGFGFHEKLLRGRFPFIGIDTTGFHVLTEYIEPSLVPDGSPNWP